MKVPLSSPWLTEMERQKVLQTLGASRLSLGPTVAEFERCVRRYVGAKYAVAVNSGTSGLHLVVRALGLGEGDEVITTPFSFIASANCLLFERVKPVFVDIDPQTLCLDPEKVEAAITKKTKAILGVDVFGHPADWPFLRRIARRHGLMLIEDSCEALGSELNNRKCGTFGDAAAFAFYPNKQITTGEGGMIVTNRWRVAELCRSMANQGRRVKNGAWLEHVRLGYNYRMSEINAALGVAQMCRIGEILKKRRQVAEWYNRLLGDVNGIEIPYVARRITLSWFVYVIRLADRYARQDRDRVLAGLRSKGVECSNYFQPIHLQPFYRREFGYRRGDFPVCETVSDRTVALPFHARMKRHDVESVVRNMKRVI